MQAAGAPSGVLKNVMSDGLSRQILPKKRSLWLINTHFEGEFNTLRPGEIVFQHPVNGASLMFLTAGQHFSWSDS
jgi:hypothetical protein